MNEPTVMELIVEYGREMQAAGRYEALRMERADESHRRAARLWDEIERRITTGAHR